MSVLDSFLLFISAVLAVACGVLLIMNSDKNRWLATWQRKYSETNSAALKLMSVSAKLLAELGEVQRSEKFYMASSKGLQAAVQDMTRERDSLKAQLDETLCGAEIVSAPEII